MHFRRSIFVFLFLSAVLASYAQTSASLPEEMVDSTEFKSLLFASFTDGIVLMKSGRVEHAPMNYNAAHQSINFIKAGKYYTLEGLQDIDTIRIQHKTFIPVGNSIYEFIQGVDTFTALLVSYTTRAKPLTATTDHNGTSSHANSEVSNTVSDVYVNRNFKAKETLQLQKHRWLKLGQNLYKADTKAQLRRIFPKKSKEEIDNYIVLNNLNLAVDDDLVTLIKFLSKK